MPSLPEYDDLDATALAALVATGEVSAAELVEAAIERIEARNPALNAVVHRMYERARAQAVDPALPDGPFRGVPFLLKDLRAEDAGEPSTGGSRALVGRVATEDAPLVRRFKRAGLIVCGRTNAAEFGIMGVTESELHGPVRNPWDRALTPGGSSGGSAAAVAARMVPLAHGGDGGGSLRIPASACGLVGLKPTRGRVPAPPAHADWSGLVVEHVLARSVRDTAGILDATCGPGPDARYPLAPPARPYREEIEAPAVRLRVAFTTRSLSADEETHADCVEAVARTAALCEELGHDVVEAGPEYPRLPMERAYFGLVAAGVAATIRHIGAARGRPVGAGEVEPATRLLGAIGEGLGAADLRGIHEAVARVTRRVEQFFGTCDVLLTPTLVRPPLRIGELDPGAFQRLATRFVCAVPLRYLLRKALRRLARRPAAPYPNTQIFNLTGQPAISLPLHWNAAGVPIGVQLAARYGDEATLLRLARQLEEARPWSHRRPGRPG